jgi:hypothetical protein
MMYDAPLRRQSKPIAIPGGIGYIIIDAPHKMFDPAVIIRNSDLACTT